MILNFDAVTDAISQPRAPWCKTSAANTFHAVASPYSATGPTKPVAAILAERPWHGHR